MWGTQIYCRAADCFESSCVKLLEFFGLSFFVFEEFGDAFGNVSAGDGEGAGDGVEEGVVAAGGADGAEAADEFDAPAVADFFHAAEQDRADLAGAADVGAAAGVELDALHLNDSEGAFARWELAEVSAGEHLVGEGAVDPVGEERAVFVDDAVGELFDAAEVVVRKFFHAIGEGEVDGGGLGAEVEADGARVEFAEEDGGEEMLAGVLLLVVGAAGHIHGTS